MSDAEEREPEAIGWDAIDGALQPVYGDREPQHFGTILPMMLGGEDPLQGMSVYRNTSPVPHYHFVTYGFSELYEKESDDPELSGFGFELTFRLACAEDASDEPPAWPLSLLQNLARYVFSSGNAFDDHHHMSLNGPIALEEETAITAILLTLDPQLGEMDTPNGHVKFLQIVGVAGDEYDLIREGYFGQVLERVCALSPLSVTDIFRESILSDPSVREAIVATAPDSLPWEVYGTLVEWTDSNGELEVRIGATMIPQLLKLLQETVSESPVAAWGTRQGVVFEPGEENGWRVEEESVLVVSVTPETGLALGEALQPVRGTYQLDQFPAMTVTVVPIEIKGQDGSVQETVG